MTPCQHRKPPLQLDYTQECALTPCCLSELNNAYELASEVPAPTLPGPERLQYFSIGAKLTCSSKKNCTATRQTSAKTAA